SRYPRSRACRARTASAIRRSVRALSNRKTPSRFFEYCTTPVSHVYFDAKTLYQSGLAEQIAEVSPSAAEQLPDALETGGQIAIPVEEYAARIAPTESAQNLVDHIKVDPEGFSRAEAAAWIESGAAEELKAAVHSALQTTEEEKAFQASADAVKETMKAQLDATGRFDSRINEAYATLVGSFYATQAGRLGTTPEALYQRAPLKVVAADGDAAFGKNGNVYGQPVTQGLNWEFGQRPGLFSLPDIEALTLTGKEFDANNIEDLRNAAYTHMEPYRSIDGAPPKKQLHNKDTGWSFVVARDNQRKLSLWHGNKPETLRAIAEIERIVETAILAESHPDTGHKNPDVQAIHVLYAPVEIDGKPYRAKLTVRDYKANKEGHGAKTNLHALSTVEIENVPLGTLPVYSSPDGLQLAQPTTGRKVSISDLLRDSKRNDASDWDTATSPTGNQFHQSPLPLPSFQRSANDPLIEASKRYFGVTTNPREAGYVLPDGTLLNLSGKHQASGDTGFLNDRREVDHGDLRGENKDGFSMADLFESQSNSPTDAMYEFMARTGAVRVDFNAGVASAIGDVTDAQLQALSKGMRGKNISLDAADFNYRLVADAGIDNASPEKIRRFFESVKGREAPPGAPYFQGENRKPRGMFDPDTLTISLLKYADASKNADLSTFLHESGHAFLQIQFSIAAELAAELSTEQGSALSGETQFLKDTQAILDWFGVKNMDEWDALPSEEKRSYHEKFARGFEAYLFEGKAPTLEMAGIFQRFRSWLKRVYHALSNLNVELSDEIRGVFDRMLASDEEIRLAEQGRNMIPLFALENAEALGWSLERFAAYQALGKDATEDAVAKLQAKALRDMKWLRNAQGRTLEQMQKEAAAARAEMEIEAKREVLSQPVYIAWRYLTGTLSKEDRAALKAPEKPKSDPDTIDPANDTLFAAIGKLGGLEKEEAVSTWGTDPADRPQSGVFGKPLWRLNGEGLSIDAMSELLSQYGYLTLDDRGKWDVRELEEKFAEELSGSPVYSLEHDYQPEPPRAGEQIPNPEALEAARLSLGDLEWMYNGEATEIARKKAELHDFLSGTPITEIPDNQAPIREGFAKVREWATKVFAEQGGKAVSPEIGEILLDERAVKDSQSHGRMSKARANAFLAVKDVIEQGRIVLTEAPHGREKIESLFIAAPVKIGTIENIVTVMVHRDMNTRRMYLHAVQIRESLRIRRVSGAVESVSPGRSGSIENEGILNILHDLLNFKDDAPENAVVGLLKARGMVAKEYAEALIAKLRVRSGTNRQSARNSHAAHAIEQGTPARSRDVSGLRSVARRERTVSVRGGLEPFRDWRSRGRGLPDDRGTTRRRRRRKRPPPNSC
ncbi:MAG: hypothetical protein LBL72_03280, partial [Candidatus Accumulibacter sp.]|nr:hypothetical protein [Accumulibacter sp.]